MIDIPPEFDTVDVFQPTLGPKDPLMQYHFSTIYNTITLGIMVLRIMDLFVKLWIIKLL